MLYETKYLSFQILSLYSRHDAKFCALFMKLLLLFVDSSLEVTYFLSAFIDLSAHVLQLFLHTRYIKPMHLLYDFSVFRQVQVILFVNPEE